uniref:Uncharacterized protein n=1 Tax=Plectus sambesii TaxID=2011161 RepID=A0A914WVV4_9BILA
MVVDFVYQPGWVSQFEWIIYTGFIICFFLSFGMGANDCANSYGTVIGAGVLKLWQAYVLATIFETLGAGMLGYQVTNTIREGIVDPSIYSVFVQQNSSNNTWMEVSNCSANTIAMNNCTELTRAEFLMGELGALTGTAFWLIFAGLFSLPVSATQSVVGATVGFTLVFHGTKGIQGRELIDIVVSWVSSPLLAGFFSTVFFLIIKFSVFKRADPLEASLNTAPFWFWFTLAVNTFTVFYGGSK